MVTHRQALPLRNALEMTGLSLILGLAPTYGRGQGLVVTCRSCGPCGLSGKGPGVDMDRMVGAITEFGAQLESLRDSFGVPVFEEPELPSSGLGSREALTFRG